MTIWHCTISLEAIARMSDSELVEMFTLGGELMTPQQTRVAAEHFAAQGYWFMPTCDHYDQRGRCLGHEERKP